MPKQSPHQWIPIPILSQDDPRYEHKAGEVENIIEKETTPELLEEIEPWGMVLRRGKVLPGVSCLHLARY